MRSPNAVSKHEAELRRRLSVAGVDIYDTVCWFLTAIDAQACVDGGPKPDLSWFEREFLKSNIELYRRRMTLPELLNAMAAAGPTEPGRPRSDMSEWSDEALINALGSNDDHDSAVEELVKRANARHLTMADYIGDRWER
jgi:hypothetical protein